MADLFEDGQRLVAMRRLAPSGVGVGDVLEGGGGGEPPPPAARLCPAGRAAAPLDRLVVLTLPVLDARERELELDLRRRVSLLEAGPVPVEGVGILTEQRAQ